MALVRDLAWYWTACFSQLAHLVFVLLVAHIKSGMAPCRPQWAAASHVFSRNVREPVFAAGDDPQAPRPFLAVLLRVMPPGAGGRVAWIGAGRVIRLGIGGRRC